MQDHPYLTTEEAAAYLRIKERKLYEMAASGAAPCSKATGKWLFPRAALDRWVEAGMARPSGAACSEPPPIIGGSHDPLLEWAARWSGSGLALLPEGSEAGLERLSRNSVAIAAIHLHDLESDARANEDAIATRPELHDAVLIAFARREQGCLLRPAIQRLRQRAIGDRRPRDLWPSAGGRGRTAIVRAIPLHAGLQAVGHA